MSANHQHLRAFHAIALEGSFSRAARRLNVAQPTLSQQIKALEKRHQAVLFEGRKPPLRLTPVGQELFALTRRLFAASEDIDQLLSVGPESPAQQVRIGSDSPIFAVHMAKALLDTHPDLHLEVRIQNASDSLNSLRDASVDVAIVSDPPVDGQFAYEPLFSDHLMVAAPRDHRLAGAASFPLAALADETLLIREPASKTRGAMNLLLGAVDVTPGRTVELHSREAIREGVALGLGVSFFLSSECPPDSRLVFLKPRPLPPRARLTGYLVCQLERRRSALMRAVVATVAAVSTLSPLPLLEPGSEPLSVAMAEDRDR